MQLDRDDETQRSVCNNLIVRKVVGANTKSMHHLAKSQRELSPTASMLPTLIPSNPHYTDTAAIIREDTTLPASFPEQGTTQQATTCRSVETFDIEHGRNGRHSESESETEERETEEPCAKESTSNHQPDRCDPQI